MTALRLTLVSHMAKKIHYTYMYIYCHCVPAVVCMYIVKYIHVGTQPSSSAQWTLIGEDLEEVICYTAIIILLHRL